TSQILGSNHRVGRSDPIQHPLRLCSRAAVPVAVPIAVPVFDVPAWERLDVCRHRWWSGLDATMSVNLAVGLDLCDPGSKHLDRFSYSIDSLFLFKSLSILLL
ncbi:hypothetical protein RRG08_038409, partial [Elysia crispata]